VRFNEIDGWLTENEGKALAALAKDGCVLELGAWKGRSTVAMAATAEYVTTVDSFTGDAETGPVDTYGEFRENIERAGVLSKIDARRGQIAAWAEVLPSAHYDLVFIDGAHDAASVERDARLALRCVKPTGAIAWHDANYRTVVDGLKAAGIRGDRPDFLIDSTAWVRLPLAPRVALVMPHYGDISPGSAYGFYVGATRGMVELVASVRSSTSATPFCMNGLLAPALDARDRGEVTHLAMLHADVEPKRDGWLDILWEEMKVHGADLMSAIVPIKEPARERTSTAIGAADDPWCPLRFVNNRDRGRLPETFGPEDVCGEGEVLLVNTGCFLADLRRPWWDDFAFEFHTRIIKRDGKRIAQLAPEDWLMSRHIQAAGGRVMATWAVDLAHHGAGVWPNSETGE
jgi:hypothetical protein